MRAGGASASRLRLPCSAAEYRERSRLVRFDELERRDITYFISPLASPPGKQGARKVRADAPLMILQKMHDGSTLWLILAVVLN